MIMVTLLCGQVLSERALRLLLRKAIFRGVPDRGVTVLKVLRDFQRFSGEVLEQDFSFGLFKKVLRSSQNRSHSLCYPYTSSAGEKLCTLLPSPRCWPEGMLNRGRIFIPHPSFIHPPPQKGIFREGGLGVYKIWSCISAKCEKREPN